MSSQSPILVQAAKFLQEVCFAEIPEDVRVTSKQAILDYIGVAIPGSDQPVTRNLLNWALKRSWAETSTVIGRSMKLDAEHAALINATAGHALDFDDTSWATIGHPTTVIVPALLGLAEESDVSGEALLVAYVAAVEVTHKIADLMMPDASENGWHTTGIFYSLGSAAGACKLLGLDQQTTVMALALALSKSSGIRSNFGTQAKPYHAGMAAKAGLEAVSLARDGVTASETALEGADGFIQCFAGAALAQTTRESAKPVMFGIGWDIVRRGYAFKKYPNCSGNHPALDVLFALLAERQIRADQVEKIHCGVSLLGPKELVSHRPRSPVEARFSLEFSIACALVYGQVTLDQFCEDCILDPRVQSLIERISMSVDDDLAKLGFIGTAPVKIWLTLKDGEEIYLENDLARGNPEKPFSNQEFSDKFRRCTQGLLPEAQAESLLAQLFQLEQVTSVRELLALTKVC
ncbi:MmgE/PrpD family protein [Motiliproteus coralliicola]|uniref:MmgE/PrpD family protein n=1 Tax=Motiliproteus coralliicola TaxID=2283196 RepID=A0A369WLR4_9GAMM|nr:MmgE/PrpD family protein [Motiliproteus coralliicola]RDE22607.1 MmgE/PrpD family protein [Motiliproteus coralliicola]